MPWKVERQGDRYCVVKTDSGERVGCHDTEAEAKAQLRALYANEQKAFRVVKQANGLYRWYGMPSNNAQDRDQEFISRVSLELDVHRTKMYGDDSELWLHHIPFRLGGAPDFRAVVDGILVESGEFDDTPVAKAIAQYIERHPEGPDGEGWGMSIGFWGVTEDGRVYDPIRIRERSALSAAKAANPYTRFSVEEVRKMALNKDQRALLEAIATDAEAREAARLILAAADQSKALDEAGVQRKEVSAPASSPPADEPNRALKMSDLADILKFFREEREAERAAFRAEQDKLIAEINKNLGVVVQAIGDLNAAQEALANREKALAEEYTLPRTAYDYLKSISASASPETVIGDDDPLAKAQPTDTSTTYFDLAGLVGTPLAGGAS